MPYSNAVYTGNGATTQFTVPFPYIRKEHVFASLNYANTAFTWVNDTTVQISPAPANGVRVEVRRVTPVTNPLVDFTDGSTLVAADLDTNYLQQTYVNQEQDDQIRLGVYVDANGNLTAGNQRIQDVANPTSAQDAATKNYVDTRDALKVDKAGDTMTGALAMSGQKITGLGDPTNAQDAVTKSWVETAGASPLVQFRSIFYGAYASDPATDPYGGARTEGDLYFNTSLDQMRVFNGASWQDVSTDRTFTRFTFTAVGGETSISGEDDDNKSLTYNVGLELVFLNGVLLTRGVDYVATTGSSITGLAALAASDLLEVVSFSQLDVIGSIPSANSTFLQAGTGAVQRTVESKLKDVISVKDFGAVGNLTTDDTAAIQAAINSVATNQETPVGIYFPTGNYRITASLTVANRNIIFYGDGPLASVVRPGPTVVNAFSIDCTGLAVKITGLYRMGIREYGVSASTTLIKVSNTTDVFLDNLYLVCSGRLIDYGPNNNFAMWNQIRGEAYGGMEAIRFRGGGGSISNMLIRKYDTSGTVGPAFWWQGSPLSSSLQVSDSSIGGSGCLSRTAITSITSTASTFTVNTGSAHGFVAQDWVVVRDAASAYYGTWLVDSATSTSVTVKSTLNAGTENPASAFLESLSACLYVDSSLGPINESIFNGVLFEGIDANGTAGKVGSVSVWLDARADTGSPLGSNIFGHRFSDCYFDVGQMGLVAQGIYVAGDAPIVSGIRLADCQVLSAKLGVYLRGTAGVQIVGNTIMPVARAKADPNDDVDSCGIWAHGLTTQNKGLQIEGNIIGRQSDWRTDVLSLRNFDFGLRIDGNSQDTYVIGNHVYGSVLPVKLEGTLGATTLNTNTRAVVQGNMLATGAGESTANRIPTIASASTIELGFNDIYQLSGTTTITAMNGGWVGRMVQLVTLSALTFSGSGFNNSLKTAAGESVTAIFDGTKWSLSSSTITPEKLSTGGPYWNSSGWLGLGTTNPQAGLHLVGQPARISVGGKSGSNTYMRLMTTDGSNPMELQVANLTNLAWEIQSVENGVANRDLVLQRQANSNLGVGVQVPLAKLHVVGGAGAIVSANAKSVSATYLRLLSTDASNTMELQIANQTNVAWEIQAVENGVSYRDIVLQRYGGNVCIGDGTPTAGTKLDVNGDKIRVRTAKTPASAAAAGNAGDICWDANYIYICTATNTWKRAAIATWP